MQNYRLKKFDVEIYKKKNTFVMLRSRKKIKSRSQRKHDKIILWPFNLFKLIRDQSQCALATFIRNF